MAPILAQALLGKQARHLASRVPDLQMSKKDPFVGAQELQDMLETSEKEN